jgi:sRNA-binding carbon storage regulator CsrA
MTQVDLRQELFETKNQDFEYLYSQIFGLERDSSRLGFLKPTSIFVQRKGIFKPYVIVRENSKAEKGYSFIDNLDPFTPSCSNQDYNDSCDIFVLKDEKETHVASSWIEDRVKKSDSSVDKTVKIYSGYDFEIILVNSSSLKTLDGIYGPQTITGYPGNMFQIRFMGMNIPEPFLFCKAELIQFISEYQRGNGKCVFVLNKQIASQKVKNNVFSFISIMNEVLSVLEKGITKKYSSMCPD